MSIVLDEENCIVNKGNLIRLKRFINRAKAGEDLTVAFLGGSITQGFASSAADKCYAALTFSDIKKRYSNENLKYINAGIGATDSEFGAARVTEDVLKYEPDLVFVEFSVNDESTPHYRETYEGLVRRILSYKSKPALILIHSVFYDSGKNAEREHRKIARYYDLPAVSMRSSIYENIIEGNLENTDISEDNLHPNDKGHRLMADVIGKIFEFADKADVKDGEYVLKSEPLTENRYAHSRIYNSADESAVTLNEGFIPDTRKKEAVFDCFKGGFISGDSGDRIVFEIAGETFAAQYMRTIHRPAPLVYAYVDEDYDHPIALDGSFDEEWGDKLCLTTLAEGLEYKVHKIEFENVESYIEWDPDIDELYTEEGSPFMLVSVIASDSKEREIIHLSPVCTHNIWGGTRLREDFGYDYDGDDLGECWGISAHPNGDGVVRGGKYDGMHLSELFKEHPELFNNKGDEDRFPLLTKIIDAKDDLSIQVHPDDTYAGKNENGSLGKMECWYVLDAPENATLVAGHNAKTKEELVSMIKEGRWNDFIREIPVKKGDFIQIDPGTVHAIKGGILLLETQQNSDITYRVYDYDRLQNGKKRELHVEKSIDVITVPAKSAEDSVLHFDVTKADTLVKMYECKYYKVYKADVKNQLEIDLPADYILLSVTEGEGYIDGDHVKKGDHMILPYGYGKACVTGNLQIILSTK